MSITTGIIRNGQLVLQEGGGEPLPEGRRFTIVIDEDQDGLDLDDEATGLLLAAQARIRRGERVSLDDALRQLEDA